MRRFALATAALAATIAFAAPALAQGKAEAIQRLCPDMTFNQIGNGLVSLVEQYEFSTDQNEAAQQAASLLCSYAGDSAEVPAEQKGAGATAATLVVPLPPQGPRFDLALPHFPRFAQPRRRMPPPRVVIRRLPPPPIGGYGMRRSAPPVVAMVGSGRGYEAAPVVRQQKQSFQSKASNYCPTQNELPAAPTHQQGTGIPYAGCEWVDQVPGKPCGGYHCWTR